MGWLNIFMVIAVAASLWFVYAISKWLTAILHNVFGMPSPIQKKNNDEIIETYLVYVGTSFLIALIAFMVIEVMKNEMGI